MVVILFMFILRDIKKKNKNKKQIYIYKEGVTPGTSAIDFIKH